ncbi:hypothetical protein KJ836_00210 [Patescibacteria group bacterium]|nr:hypothetical protein [Patescibacteria group bacterium]
MNKLFTIIISVVITVVVLVGIAIFIASRLGLGNINLRAILSGKKIESTYDHPLLSSSQEELLKSFGVDPATLPTTIPANLEQCATDALGGDRVNQIKSGMIPTISDYLKAQQCLK